MIVSSSNLASQPATHIDPRKLIGIGLLLLSANLLTLLQGWGDVVGLLAMGVLLPGLLASAWLLHRALPPRLEFVAYSLGLGFLIYILVLLGIVSLPGPIHRWQIQGAFSALCVLLAIGWWHANRQPVALFVTMPPAPPLNRWALAGLVSVLLVAGLLRLPNLGYSDYHGDEARALLRAAEAIQGYASALLIHKKGPAEILFPLGIYAVQGTITEAEARIPFTLAGMVGIFAIYLLGWRMFGAVAGTAAAMLLAVDGYFIGFARIVQYQSIVFCMSTVVLLALYKQARADRPLPAYLLVAGLCFVGGIYSHYEALWVLIPGLYLLALYVQRTRDFKGLLRALILPTLITLGLLLIFFVPFLLDARWNQTASDIFGNRIGNRFPYNNLRDFFERTAVYDSVYYIIFMMVMALVAKAIVLHQAWSQWVAWGITALTAAGLALTFFVRPDWLIIAGTDQTWLFFALSIAVLILAPRIRPEDRTIWLWFGIPMVLSIFFVAKPNSHVYGFFMGWALIVGSALEVGWQALRKRVGISTARWIALPVAGIFLFIFANYAFHLFTYTRVEILRTWTTNRPWGYWAPFESPTRGALFGFPNKNGWKVIGALYADGTLNAPFDSNETSRVGEWYSHGPYFCPPDAQYYMVPTVERPVQIEEVQEQVDELMANGFLPWGVVTVQGDERLRIFSKQPQEQSQDRVEGQTQHVRIFEASDYQHHFDANLSSPFFLKNGPATIAQPQSAVNYRLNEHLWLKGYSLPQQQVAPGEQMKLQLFWETDQALDSEDKTFIQLIDLNTLQKAAQRDGEPGCSVYSMDEWRAGELNLDPYTLTIAPDAAPGIYTLLVGAYDAESHERYHVFAPDGADLGDAIPLTTIEVVAR